MIEDKKTKFFYGYIIVFAAFLIMVFTWGTQYSFGVFFKPVLFEFGWTRAATSGAFSLCIILNGFLAIFTGRLSDRFGPRIVMTLCGIALGVGYILMSQISAIWQLYLFYGVLMGIGVSGSYTPSMSTIARWFVKKRGLMIGIAASGVGFGTLVMAPTANFLISNYGWRTSYTIIGVVVLTIIVTAAQFIKRDPTRLGLKPYGESQTELGNINSMTMGFSFKRAIQTKQFWMLCPVFLCQGFVLSTILVHIAPHATDLAISPANAASILSVIGGASIAGRIVLGNLGERSGNKKAILVSFIVMFSSLLWLLITKELWMFYLFTIAFGFAYGGIASLISLISAELFGLGSLGIIIGAFIFSSTIGEAIGPALTGKIFDMTSSYQSAFLICIALIIIAIIFVLLLKPIAYVSTRRVIDNVSGED